jgi:hypothetical protein
MKVLKALLKWTTYGSGVAALSTSHFGRTRFESRLGLRLSWQDFHQSLQANTCFQILAQVTNDDNLYSLHDVTRRMQLKWRHYIVSQIHTDIQHTLGHHVVNTCPITRVYVPSQWCNISDRELFPAPYEHGELKKAETGYWRLLKTYKQSCVYTWFTFVLFTNITANNCSSLN